MEHHLKLWVPLPQFRWRCVWGNWRRARSCWDHQGLGCVEDEEPWRKLSWFSLVRRRPGAYLGATYSYLKGAAETTAPHTALWCWTTQRGAAAMRCALGRSDPPSATSQHRGQGVSSHGGSQVSPRPPHMAWPTTDSTPASVWAPPEVPLANPPVILGTCTCQWVKNWLAILPTTASGFFFQNPSLLRVI